MVDSTELEAASYRRKILLGSVVTCLVSAVFWLWALYNILAKGTPDLGVVTFAIAYLSGASGIVVGRNTPFAGDGRYSSRLNLHLCLLVSGSTLVVINYLGALVLIWETAGVRASNLRIYFGVAAGLWLVQGLCLGVIVARYKKVLSWSSYSSLLSNIATR